MHHIGKFYYEIVWAIHESPTQNAFVLCNTLEDFVITQLIKLWFFKIFFEFLCQWYTFNAKPFARIFLDVIKPRNCEFVTTGFKKTIASYALAYDFSSVNFALGKN